MRHRFTECQPLRHIHVKMQNYLKIFTVIRSPNEIKVSYYNYVSQPSELSLSLIHTRIHKCGLRQVLMDHVAFLRAADGQP